MQAKTLMTLSLLALGGLTATLPPAAVADPGMLLAVRDHGRGEDGGYRQERSQRQEAGPPENPRDLGYGYGYERREADRARWRDRDRNR